MGHFCLVCTCIKHLVTKTTRLFHVNLISKIYDIVREKTVCPSVSTECQNIDESDEFRNFSLFIRTTNLFSFQFLSLDGRLKKICTSKYFHI